MSYKVKWIGKNVRLSFSGELYFNDILKANDYLIGHANFDRLKYQIWDFRHIKNHHINAFDMIVISTLDNGASYWNRHVKVAIAATDPDLLKLATGYVEAMQSTNWQCKLFHDYGEAEDWCLQ